MDRGGGRIRRTAAERRPRGPFRGRRPPSTSTLTSTSAVQQQQPPSPSIQQQQQPLPQQWQQEEQSHRQGQEQEQQQQQQRIVIGAETTTCRGGSHHRPPSERTRLTLPTPKCQREDGDGVEDCGGGVGVGGSVDETELLAKLRCPSESAEVIAEREKRRLRRRCPDYPGLALSSSVFSTETGMKFSIIRNELHNVLKPQLRRVSLWRRATMAAAAVATRQLIAGHRCYRWSRPIRGRRGTAGSQRFDGATEFPAVPVTIHRRHRVPLECARSVNT